MIKTEADLLELTSRQRDLLSLLTQELSRDEVARFLCTAESAANVDQASLLQAYDVAAKALLAPGRRC